MTSLPLSQAFAFRISPAAPIPMPEQSRLMMALEIRMAEAMAKDSNATKWRWASQDRPYAGVDPETLSKSINVRRANCAARRKVQQDKLIAAMRKRGPQSAAQLAPVISISPGHTTVIIREMVAAGMVRAETVWKTIMYSVPE